MSLLLAFLAICLVVFLSRPCCARFSTSAIRIRLIWFDPSSHGSALTSPGFAFSVRVHADVMAAWLGHASANRPNASR